MTMQTHNQAALGATPIFSSMLGSLTEYGNQMVNILIVIFWDNG